jgi:hypothetical protein
VAKHGTRIVCDYCGADVGEATGKWYDRESTDCGAIECGRAIREMELAARDERRKNAEDDDYGRY